MARKSIPWSNCFYLIIWACWRQYPTCLSTFCLIWRHVMFVTFKQSIGACHDRHWIPYTSWEKRNNYLQKYQKNWGKNLLSTTKNWERKKFPNDFWRSYVWYLLQSIIKSSNLITVLKIKQFYQWII